jgi:hypothetical protein
MKKIIITLIALIIIAGGAVWYVKTRPAPFCFNFVHDTQFGERKVAHPSNQGIGTPGGMMYYLPEVPALQTALTREGFYVDPYEATGGKVYYGPFFGPTTQVAVKAFQKKYGIAETGTVENGTIDKLRSLYGCPTVASSTASVS